MDAIIWIVLATAMAMIHMPVIPLAIAVLTLAGYLYWEYRARDPDSVSKTIFLFFGLLLGTTVLMWTVFGDMFKM